MTVGADTLEAVRAFLASHDASALVINRLTRTDLADLEWSGAPSHLDAVASALDRADSGAVDYFALRAPDGKPVAKGGVDNDNSIGPGKLWQLATHPELQSHGLGTALIAAMEFAIRERGLSRAWLGVELDNPRAMYLYERLGYSEFDRVPDGWETEDAHGNRYWYSTEVVLMEKLFRDA